MQVIAVGEPLDGRDLRTIRRDREHQAGVDPPAVEQDRARPALPIVAALLRAGQAERLAQQVQQRGPVIDIQRRSGLIDAELAAARFMPRDAG